MKLVSASPRVSESDVAFMLRRMKMTEEDITKALGDGWVLSIRPQGNYTVAMITTKLFPTAMGVSKRNPVDDADENVGAKIALRRCFQEVKDLG